MRLFRQFIVRRLTQERLRTAVAVGGIALGVAVVVAIRLANQSSVSGFASFIANRPIGDRETKWDTCAVAAAGARDEWDWPC